MKSFVKKSYQKGKDAYNSETGQRVRKGVKKVSSEFLREYQRS